MKPLPGTAKVVVTGIGLVCPRISSRTSLVGLRAPAGLAQPRTTPADLAQSGTSGQRHWFDPERFLGPRGWKYHSPASRYLLAAAGLALAESGLEPVALPGESMAVVIGTNFAATPVVARFDQAVLADGSGTLSPAQAPSFSVNIPASQLSVRYGIRGFNLTLTNPMVAGLEAMLTLGSAVRAGKVTAGLAGATEEDPDDAAGKDGEQDRGEGACCLVLETEAAARARGALALTELCGGFSRFIHPSLAGGPSRGGTREPSRKLLDAALGHPLRALTAGLADQEDLPLPLVTIDGVPGGGWLAEYCADRCADAGVPVTRLGYPGWLGSHFTLSALLQVAGLATEFGHGLVVCAGPQGNVAAVLLRAHQGEQERT